MVSLTFQGGWFHRILGKAVEGNEFIFIPVLGDLGDREIAPYQQEEEGVCIPLSKFIEGTLPRTFVEFSNWNGESDKLVDAAWVRARILAIFGKNIVFSGFIPDYKYRLIEQMFVACERITKEEWIAYPFICEDCALCTQLRFNINDALVNVYERIVRDFGQLLLREVERVDNFCDGYLHYNELDDEEWWCIALKDKQFQIERLC